MEEITRTNKAKTKDIVLLVIASVILIGSIIFLCLPIGFGSLTDMLQGPEGESDLPGGKVVASIYVLIYLAVVGVIVTVAIFVCWGMGLIISILLTMKKDAPRWLHISSLVLALIYSALIVCLILTILF